MKVFLSSALLLAYAHASLAADGAATCQNVIDPAALSTSCGFAKPEDVQFVSSLSLLLVSEQGWQAPDGGGAISSVPVDTQALRLGAKRKLWPSVPTHPKQLIGAADCTAPPTELFSPHGLAVLEQGSDIRLAIINHAGREAVELFAVTRTKDGVQLEWRGCVPLPADTAGNDVALLADGRMFVTNYIPTVHGTRGLLATIAALRGQISGDVLEWSPHDGWRHLPNTAAAMPNGIIVDATGRTLYVSELGKQRVLQFELEDSGGVERRAEYAFRDLPDNLNWTARGTILVAGQTRKDIKQWSAAEIQPGGGVRALFTGQSAIHSVTSATDVGSAIVFGSTSDERIAIAKWPQ
jgi:hypothetical protein